LSIAKNVFVFIGPPGSGKGSLSNLCVQKLQWVQLSTGNLCRKHIAEQTPIGKEIDFAIKSGNLVSDDLITAMVEDWLREEIQKPEEKTVILDGYPRTSEQAKAFDTLLKTQFKGLQLQVVRLNIPDATLVKRLSSRVVCQNKDCQAVYSLAEDSLLKPKRDMICDLCGSPLGRRKDDEISTIQERLHVYRKHEQGLLDYFKKIDQPIMELNAEKPLPMVFDEFKKMIAPLLSSTTQKRKQEVIDR
jgi:adenylate kinase